MRKKRNRACHIKTVNSIFPGLRDNKGKFFLNIRRSFIDNEGGKNLNIWQI